MNRFLLFFLIIFFLIDIFLNPGIIEKEKFSEKRIKDEYKDLSRFKNCKNCNILALYTFYAYYYLYFIYLELVFYY